MAEGLTSFVMTWNFIKFSVTILIVTENVKMYSFTVHIINKLSSTNRDMLQTYISHSGKQTVQWSVLEQKNSFLHDACNPLLGSLHCFLASVTISFTL